MNTCPDRVSPARPGAACQYPARQRTRPRRVRNGTARHSPGAHASMQPLVPVELSFCVVNTEQRGLLRYCLDAIARERAPVDFETEVLVLDNASQDGSVDVARRHPVTTEVIALTERRGKGVNDSELLQRARGRFCLLLNEDSELEPGATVALHAALSAEDGAGAAGAPPLHAQGGLLPAAGRV